jgi:hypothetical protein
VQALLSRNFARKLSPHFADLDASLPPNGQACLSSDEGRGRTASCLNRTAAFTAKLCRIILLRSRTPGWRGLP